MFTLLVLIALGGTVYVLISLLTVSWVPAAIIAAIEGLAWLDATVIKRIFGNDHKRGGSLKK